MNKTSAPDSGGALRRELDFANPARGFRRFPMALSFETVALGDFAKVDYYVSATAEFAAVLVEERKNVSGELVKTAG